MFFISSFCLKNLSFNEMMRIGGYWDENEIYFLEIMLQKCTNSSSSNIICKPQETIDEFFKNFFYFSFYINENNIDENNFENPIYTNYITRYTSLDIFLLKDASLFLKKGEIITNDGLVLDNLKYNTTFLIGEYEIDISSQNKMRSEIAYMLDFSIYPSSYKTVVSRDYQNLAELFANISGLLNFLILLGFFICNFENKYNVAKYLLNKLYIVQEVSERKKQKMWWKNEDLNNKMCSSNILDDLSSKIVNENSREENKLNKLKNNACLSKIKKIVTKKLLILSKYLCANKKDNNSRISPISKRERLNILNEKRKFKFSFLEYIKFRFKCNIFNHSKKEKLFSKASEQLAKDLDLVNILKKLQDIEKLKKILLNDEEIFCFDLISKPIICLDDKKISENSPEKIFFSAKSKREIQENYVKLEKSSSNVAKRLIRMIDNQVKPSLRDQN